MEKIAAKMILEGRWSSTAMTPLLTSKSDSSRVEMAVRLINSAAFTPVFLRHTIEFKVKFTRGVIMHPRLGLTAALMLIKTDASYAKWSNGR